ncbi:hypothetical protein L596_004757 [Steinernema carpocapsae]|uniref:Uncharacterized protein n=1 Tax=Steinernema carpocapsae TaxID=34508 RepID=A0A4U8UWS1_STECR|nr:hypothetical protein L596_004757 [Steinernema carpocapsae]
MLQQTRPDLSELLSRSPTRPPREELGPGLLDIEPLAVAVYNCICLYVRAHAYVYSTRNDIDLHPFYREEVWPSLGIGVIINSSAELLLRVLRLTTAAFETLWFCDIPSLRSQREKNEHPRSHRLIGHRPVSFFSGPPYFCPSPLVHCEGWKGMLPEIDCTLRTLSPSIRPFLTLSPDGLLLFAYLFFLLSSPARDLKGVSENVRMRAVISLLFLIERNGKKYYLRLLFLR